MFSLNIYPIDVPEIKFDENLDFLLMELPPRYIPMMPNGLGHVSNILKNININYQVFDANIIIYHMYHSNRILNNIDNVVTLNGFEFPEDPWNVTFVDDWDTNDNVQNYFSTYTDKIILEILKVKPKIIGFSLNGNNLNLTKTIARTVKKMLPESIILVGGYSCVFSDIGPKVFKDYDYMVIGESELSLANLVKLLLQGEKPKNTPGVISKYDSSDWEFTPAPLLHDLDSIDFPRYEWIDYNLYKTYLGTNLIPIAGSRGCVWSRCTFCSEKFMWRRRDPKKIVDEFEWHSKKYGLSFHFNESDLNGDPESLIEVCNEVIKRKLKIKFFGQLRIHKDSSRDFFDILKRAGFDRLRFGVDGWSKNTNRIQKKGYPMSLIDENLKNCYEAGIEVGVNIVLGVPGETDSDVEETIQRIAKNRKYIFKVENINLLILSYGSSFFENPEKYNIKFNGNKDEIYKNNPNSIPANLWYWEKDGVIVTYEDRKNRLKKITKALEDIELYFTPYTNKRLNKTLEIKNQQKEVLFDTDDKIRFKDMLNDKLIIYGVGEIGRRIVHQIDDTTNVYLTDSNPKHWGSTIYGVEVISNENLLNYANQVLIASNAYTQEIKTFLKDNYSNDLNIITLDNIY